MVLGPANQQGRSPRGSRASSPELKSDHAGYDSREQTGDHLYEHLLGDTAWLRVMQDLAKEQIIWFRPAKKVRVSQAQGLGSFPSRKNSMWGGSEAGQH